MASKDFGRKYDRFYCTIVTPYKDNFDVDEQALRKFLRYFIQPKFLDIGGAIIVNAQAGELDHLSREEKKRNVEIAVEECGGKMPVFAGVGGTRTEDILKVAQDVKEVGADGYMLFSSIWGGVGSWDAEVYPEIWLEMAKTICSTVYMPVIGHPTSRHHPIWGIGLPLNPTVQTCKEIPNIIGWKMVYNLECHPMVGKALRSVGHHVGIFQASGSNFHDAFATGYVDGSVSGSFNYAMEPMVEHINAWKRDDIKEARRIWLAGLQHLHEYFYVPINRLHVRYKIGAWLRGLIPNPFMRPPLSWPRQSEVSVLRERLNGCGLTLIPENEIKRVTSKLLP